MQINAIQISRRGTKAAVVLMLFCFAFALFSSLGSKVLCYSNKHIAIESIHDVKWAQATVAASEATLASVDCASSVSNFGFSKCIDVPFVETEFLFKPGLRDTTFVLSALWDFQRFWSFVSGLRSVPPESQSELTFAIQPAPSALQAEQHIRTIVLRI